MLLFDIKQEMYSPVITRCSLHTAAYYAWGARITQYACTSTALQERKNAYSLFVFLQHIYVLIIEAIIEGNMNRQVYRLARLVYICTRKRTHLGFLPNDFGGRHFVAADV